MMRDRETAFNDDTLTDRSRQTLVTLAGESINDIKRFVTSLRERTTADQPQHHSEPPDGANDSTVQQVTCDAILTYINVAGDTG